MDFTKLKDPAIKQGTDEFVSGQAGSLSESVANSAKYGWNSSKKAFNQVMYARDKFWDTMGADFSEELEKREKELQIYTEIARELRDKNANYLAGSGSNGLIRNLGVGVVNGLASMVFNGPEMSLNVVSGLGVGSVTGKLALTGVKKFGVAVAGEVAENMIYDAFDKTTILEEEYTGDHFKESLKNNVAMGTSLGLIKLGISKVISESTKVNKKVVPNSEKRKAPNNPEIVSPEEILTDVKNTIDNKNKATGFLNEADELEASKTYLGKSAEEVEVLQAKGVENLTEAELQIVKNYEDGNFDIDAEKVMEVVKKEADPEIKVEKMKEENKTLIEPIKNEIDSEKATTLEVLNKSIEEENHFIDLENEKIRKNYESELEKAELYNVMEDMKPEGEPRNYKEVEPPQYKERKKLVTAEEIEVKKTNTLESINKTIEEENSLIDLENEKLRKNYEIELEEAKVHNAMEEVEFEKFESKKKSLIKRNEKISELLNDGNLSSKRVKELKTQYNRNEKIINSQYEKRIRTVEEPKYINKKEFAKEVTQEDILFDKQKNEYKKDASIIEEENNAIRNNYEKEVESIKKENEMSKQKYEEETLPIKEENEKIRIENEKIINEEYGHLIKRIEETGDIVPEDIKIDKRSKQGKEFIKMNRVNYITLKNGKKIPFFRNKFGMKSASSNYAMAKIEENIGNAIIGIKSLEESFEFESNVGVKNLSHKEMLGFKNTDPEFFADYMKELKSSLQAIGLEKIDNSSKIVELKKYKTLPKEPEYKKIPKEPKYKEVPEFNPDDYKHLTKDVEVETSKVDGEDAKSKKEVVKPTDEEIAEAEKQTKKIIKNIKSNKGMNSKEKRKRIDYAQKRFESYKKGSKNASYLKEKIFNESDVMEGKTVATPYSGNKIQELLMIRSMKNVKNYLDEKGLLPNRLTFRKILKTNIIDHYENVQKRTANFIANSLNSVVDGRNMDFVETIKNIEELGFKLKDLINDIDGTKVKELPPHLQSAVMTLKESIGSLEKVFKSFDADFDIELAVANAHFSRNNFFKVLGKDLGLKFDSKGNLDLRKLTPEQIRKMAEKYAFANRELFNGENGGQKMANAFTTFNNLLLELKAGGLRGTGGADTLRTTAFHNFSILAKAFDDELISKQNFIKTLEAFDYGDGKFGFANLIKGLSEAKALKDTLGDELGNFVDSGSHASKRFGEIFGIENSGAYIKEIQGVQRFIRKKMGLHSEVSSPILSAMDSVLSGIYFGIKPLMATFQVAEVGVSALHRAIAWENGLLSAPMNLVRDMAGLTKDIKMREASDFYKVIADGTQELIDDVFKEIDNINLKDAGTNMWLIKRTLGKIDDVADTLSLMRPFEKFTDKIAGMYAVNKTKSFLADGYDVITKNPIVKQALDVAGFTKEEFDFLSKNLIDSDAVDSGSIYKIIKDMDTGDLKKAYNISDKEMTFLLTEKFNRLQEIILETGKSTKANQLDYLDGSTVGSAMINKSVMFLRKSGIQSVRRAWDMFVASAQHHNAGSPVNSIGVKNMAKLAMMTPLFFYLNGVSKSFKDFATTNKDVVEIIDENFSLLTDEYGDVEDVEKIMFELAKSPVESLYLNLVINSGMIGNMVDRVSRSIAKGDAVGVAKAIEPRASKTIRKRILD